MSNACVNTIPSSATREAALKSLIQLCSLSFIPDEIQQQYVDMHR